MPTFWSGNGGSVAFAGTTLIVTKWSRRPANRKADTTASDTAGWQRKQGTLYGWSGTVSVLWDSDALPAGTGILMNAIGQMILKFGASAGLAAGPALIDGPGEEVDNQNGVVTYELAWESVGPWVEQT